MVDGFQNEGVKLSDIIDVNFLQEFQDNFARTMNIASFIFDDDGPITKPSNFSEICCKYIQLNPILSKKCEECIKKWKQVASEKGKPVIYSCNCGLTDFVVPIMFKGKHIAYILGGQVLTKNLDEDYFKNVARNLGFNEDEYLNAVRKIKIISNEQVESASQILYIIANAVSEIAHKNFELIKKNTINTILMKINEIISCTLDIDEILSFICVEVAKLFNVQRVKIVEFLEQNIDAKYKIKKEYQINKNIKTINDSDKHEQASLCWEEYLHESNNIIAFDNISKANVPDCFKQIYESIGVKSIIGAIVQKEQKKLGGIILFEYDHYRQWKEDEISLLKTIADQIYIAINQAELFEKAQKKAQSEKAILNNFPFIAWLKDRKGKFLAVNTSFANQCKTTVDEIIGKTDMDVYQKELAEKSIEDDIRVINSRQKIIVEEKISGPDGIKWYETFKTPVFDEEGNVVGVAGFSRDITDRKEVDRIKNEFVSMVSHELRTPLTSIRGALGLITGSSMSEGLSEKAKELLGIANNNSVRLINLINDILDIEKIEAGKMDFNIELLDLIPIVEQAILANIQYAQKFNVKLELESSLKNVRVNVDKNRLIQVITNLLSNAIKFSHTDSTVKISVTKEHNKVRVSVTNYGLEVPMEFRHKIFQKFAQADSSDSRQKGGTGLGLSISKAIIEKMNGNIEFVSQNNETSFYFDLPEFVELTPVIADRTDANQPNVLICEDDKDVALLLSLLLERENYVADIAYSAAQAKQLLAQRSYDALVLDLILPGQSGISLIKELRENKETENLPIIVVSIKANEGAKELDGHFAVLDWIDKPIDRNKLMNALKRAISVNNFNKPKMLHVEDNEDILEITKSVFEGEANLSQVTNLKDAKEILEKEEFDLLLLDLELPDGNGAELLSMLNKNENKKIITVIFSAHDVNENIAEKVDTVLFKSNTSNDDLLKIVNLIKQRKHLESHGS